ncbi:MAG: hypothetical protein Q8R60_16540 [Mycobacteriales bacterium]|nr:hypothetical protein [Mycobacteriales bacterium]
MPPAVPTPVAAALGLVPTVVRSVRRLPGKAVQLPVLVVSQALVTAESVRREYDELADRGEKLVAKLRGTSFDEIEDHVEELVEKTPFAGAYDKVEDTLEDAGEAVSAKVRDIGSAAKAGVGAAKEKGTSLVDDLQGELDAAEDVPDAEAPKGEPTPKATQPDSTRVDTAATPDVVAVVEQVAAAVDTEVPTHAELPLADYDHMTLGSLRGRLRSLSLEQLVQVRDYEKSKADRLPVVTMLDNRIAKLATETAALPAAAPSDAPAPEQVATAKAPKKPGKVTAAATAKTSAPRTKVRTT